MPIYEFQCRKCGQESEMLLPTTDWSEAKCPHCGAGALEKKLSVFATSGSQNDAAESCCMAEGGGGCGSCCCSTAGH